MSDNAQAANLWIARKIALLGVPVFRAMLLGSNDMPTRKGWGLISPASSIPEIDSWSPIEAMCARMGVVFDAIDYDPRNDVNKSGLKELVRIFREYKPTVYLKVTTPSGGYHWWIASLGMESRQTNLPGVDYIGHGWPICIPPTMRRPKDKSGICYGERMPYKVVKNNLSLPLERSYEFGKAIMNGGSTL